jgi:general secretion pathway protein H
MGTLRVALTVPARGGGFTLLEVLVVIVIIGIIVSAATLGIGVLGRDREAEDQSRRFWAVLQQAREEAELQSLDVGVYVARSGYEFLRYDRRRSKWTPIAGDELYAARELPEGLRLRLWLDSREVVLKPTLAEREEQDEDEEDDDAEDPRPPPQIMLLSSGDIMPFDLQVERDSQAALWRVVGTTDNDLRVERRNGDIEEWQIMARTKPVEEDEETGRARVAEAR